jgi:hypothetical protein
MSALLLPLKLLLLALDFVVSAKKKSGESSFS